MQATTRTRHQTTQDGSRIRAVAFGLAALMAALQGVNAVRAFADPAGFAAYMGAGLGSPADAAWVQIYGVRTFFIALFVAALAIRRDSSALKWVALAALIIPAGDAWIVSKAGAGLSTVARHLAIFVYVAVTTLALFAASRRSSA